MSWISDVKQEIKDLDVSKKKLKNFGLLIGGILLIISIWMLFKNRDVVQYSNSSLAYLLLIVGAVLFLVGLFFSKILMAPYKVWMGLAFFLGWIVSRVLITILFYIVATPLGNIAKLFGKDFLDLKFKDNKNSYWVKKPSDKHIDYKKMY